MHHIQWDFEESRKNMYTVLDDLLKQETTVDAWYDDGFIIAQDIMKDFTEADWKKLNDEILSKDLEWQKKIAYCLDGQLIEEEANILCKLLLVKDDELLEICLDTLRSFDNELGRQIIKNNPQILKKVEDRMKDADGVEKKMLEKFISIFGKCQFANN